MCNLCLTSHWNRCLFLWVIRQNILASHNTSAFIYSCCRLSAFLKCAQLSPTFCIDTFQWEGSKHSGRKHGKRWPEEWSTILPPLKTQFLNSYRFFSAAKQEIKRVYWLHPQDLTIHKSVFKYILLKNAHTHILNFLSAFYSVRSFIIISETSQFPSHFLYNDTDCRYNLQESFIKIAWLN